MKTPIRTLISNSNNGNYKLMEIQILTPKFETITDDYFEPMGSIRFQQTVGEERWYGKSFFVETTNVNHLEKMAKLAKFIEKNSNWDSTPDDIKKLIGADEYAIFGHEFVSVSKKGQILFDVIKGESVYTRVVAPNEKTALKIMKIRKIEDVTLKENSVVNF